MNNRMAAAILRNANLGGVLRDAADYAIGRLTQQEWISVNEKLPEIGQRVLVCSLFDLQNVGWHLGDGRWQIKTAYPDTPTHWMPLPEPPKGGCE